jgi:DNA-binding response OmpR family regulator
MPLILLVEANSFLRQVIVFHLEHAGYQLLGVESFASVQDVLGTPSTLLTTGSFGLLILDLDQLNLGQAADVKAWGATPVILLASERPPQRVCRPDAVCFLQKPFDMRALRRQVSAALSGDSSRD